MIENILISSKNTKIKPKIYNKKNDNKKKNLENPLNNNNNNKKHKFSRMTKIHSKLKNDQNTSKLTK